MPMIKQKILSSAKVIVCENELKPGMIKVDFGTILDNAGQKNIQNFLKPESKLASFVYCEIY